MVLMPLRAMTAHILSQICAVVFTSPLTSRLCSQLQELQELPTSPLRMWSSSKKHQLILTLAPGPEVEPGSRGHEADALPRSYPHIQHERIWWSYLLRYHKEHLGGSFFALRGSSTTANAVEIMSSLESIASRLRRFSLRTSPD